MKLVRTTRLLPILLLLGLGACSILEPDRIDYKSSGRGVSLEIPPDLTQLPGQSRYVVPGSPVSASAYQVTQAASVAAGAPTAASSIADVHFERDGSKRWLRVDRPADKLWSPVRDFWMENGFLLAIDQPNIGIMETDWAENRAKIPQDFIRATIGKFWIPSTRLENATSSAHDLNAMQMGEPTYLSPTEAWKRCIRTLNVKTPSGNHVQTILSWRQNSCAG